MCEKGNICTVGSLVEVEGTIQMVSGYRLFDDAGIIGIGYLVVPYPLGVLDESSIAVVPSRSVERVLFAGHGDQQALDFVKPLDELVSERVESDELPEYYRYLRDELDLDNGRGELS